jgi:hypothetical protein
MVKRYMVVLILVALQTSALVLAFSPHKKIVGFYMKNWRPFAWYMSTFRPLTHDDRKAIIDTLCMLQCSMEHGIKWVDKGNIKPKRLEKIPALVYPFLLAKTWSPEKCDKLIKEVITPLYDIPYARFVCEHNLSFSSDLDDLIAQSGMTRGEVTQRLCELMLETIKSCLRWTGTSADNIQEVGVNVPVSNQS